MQNIIGKTILIDRNTWMEIMLYRSYSIITSTNFTANGMISVFSQKISQTPTVRISTKFLAFANNQALRGRYDFRNLREITLHKN